MVLPVLAGDSVSPTDFVAIIQNLGVLGAVMVGAWLLFTERLIPGKRLRDREQEFREREAQQEREYQKREQQLAADRDKWQRLALSGTSLAERMVEVATRKGETT